MKPIVLVAVLMTQAAFAAPVTPPVAAARPHEVKSVSGNRVDPYFWLRDDTRSDPEVLAYLRAENAYKDAMLSHTTSLQEKLYSEIVARIKQDDSTAPYLKGGYWYYKRYQRGGEHPIHARKRAPDGPEEILVDGNERARGHGYYDLGAVEISPNGRHVAFAEDIVGRYQYAIRVRDMHTGKLLPDALENVETDIAWANDNRTFLYVAKHATTLLGSYVRRHALGSPPDADPLVFEQADTSFYTHVARSKSGRFVFLFMESTLSSEWRYAEAGDPRLAFKTVLPREALHEYQVAHLDERFIIRTNWKAPNFRVMEVPIAQVQYFEPAKWVAKLRAMKTDSRPLLLHVNMDAGHAGQTGRFQQYRELALEYAFALDRLGIRE